jgi:heat-inducible transcriptional repressor
MASIWEDLQSVHRVLEVLEREAMVLSLVSGLTPGTTIQIGEEIPVEGAEDLAMVAANYELGETGGTIGVLGPMRMDYRRTISIVEEVRDNLADRLGS